MFRLFLKALAVGIASTLASLAISLIFVPLMGGRVAGAGLVMTIVCPLAISIPVSLFHFHQAGKLRAANLALAEARDKLDAAYRLLQSQSRRDPLTSLLNRAAFMAELQLLSNAGAHGGLLFLDIDHFKSINDRFGHAAGDEALRRTGVLIARLAGNDNPAGRLGGEEFAVFFGGVSDHEMMERSQHIRRAVEALDLRAPDGTPILLRMSIGAFHCGPRFDPEKALAASDRNLYRAKSMGRNRVVA
ncbi:GGDEF domain-containing protein [Shinella daejeonensis]|uniref:GGDEF domain-containing protein n=1 Tax=Shinella daejeonensis TaxID=659017 RepID=UPI0020C7618A|nr:GGDEF domain-containing protein [Shinella daejeonensis]MCP8893669.1 GGDEF domain-containing protein [Shinella daejeonensis]